MVEDFELVITRTFDAARELVWRAHTNPECLKEWWGPAGFERLSMAMDLRPGGTFLYGLRSPDGAEIWGRFVFREIIPMEILVYVMSFSDATGGVTRHPLSETWPLELLSTVSFEEVNGKTVLTLTSSPINATEDERQTFAAGHESMQKGFGGTYGQLDAFLASSEKGDV